MMNDPAVQAAYLGGVQNVSSPAKVSVITPLDKVEASNHLAGEPVTTAQRYIQPSVADHEMVSRNQVSGIDINSLVGRASDLAESSIVSNTVSVRSSSQPSASNRLTQGRRSDQQISSSDPDVKNLLADFESAALKIRQSSHGATEGDARRAAATSNIIHDDERLPKIPVYRRSKLEVYHRTPAGDLMKIEER